MRHAALGTLVLLLVIGPRIASADDGGRTLSCGVPVTAHLESGEVDEYQLAAANNAVTQTDVIDVSGTIDTLNLRVGDKSTCGGGLLASSGHESIEVSDCIGRDAGDYTICSNVVSAGPDNCATPAPCGAEPYVRRLNLAGQVDAYSFSARAGDYVAVGATSGSGAPGGMRLRLFDPNGSLMSADSCSGTVRMTVHLTGTYTALVSACGSSPKAGLYVFSLQAPSCPAGPEITHFGIARADGSPLPPDEIDEQGRSVYARDTGAGFLLVLEARPGSSAAPVGDSTFNETPNDPTALPDLQVLLSRPLGNGSLAVCDKFRPNQGGVPATPELDFATTQAEADAMNDFGCRFEDGTGQPRGVTALDACTFFPDGDYHFVDPSSTLQFCSLISTNWAFRSGNTIVKARVRDTQGLVGPARELILRVPYNCTGDCNGDEEVTVDEIVVGVQTLLGDRSLAGCEAMDDNHDGMVTIDELLKAVNAALNGCYPTQPSP